MRHERAIPWSGCHVVLRANEAQHPRMDESLPPFFRLSGPLYLYRSPLPTGIPLQRE